MILKKRIFKCEKCKETSSSQRWNFRTLGFLKKNFEPDQYTFTPIGKGKDSDSNEYSYMCPACNEKVGIVDIKEVS